MTEPLHSGRDSVADAPVSGAAHAMRMLLAVAIAVAGAVVCIGIHAPLPWLIGPLVAVALVSMLHARLAVPPAARQLGQWAIGVALGLYFSPEVMREVVRLAPWLLLAILFAIMLGAVGSWALARATGTDGTTAFFAMAIGGASEMATQAQRHGGRVDRVAAAHSLRILIVVVTIPFAYQALGIHGVDVAAPAVQQVSAAGLLALLALSAAGMALLAWLGTPNPWVLGALGSTALVTALGVELSALPRWASNAGQLFIGVALGVRFTPDFVRAAPRWLAAVALGTLAMIVASAAFAAALARGAGLHWATVLLGTSPGGIAEMCITAKVLQLGVPVVTAFHVTRYVAVVLLTTPLYRWEARRGRRA